jgi:hypothetical protein
MNTFKKIVSINNSKFIFNINWSTVGATWYVVERRNSEEIHLPLAFTFSRIEGCPVFRIMIFKLALELAIK